MPSSCPQLLLIKKGFRQLGWGTHDNAIGMSTYNTATLAYSSMTFDTTWNVAALNYPHQVQATHPAYNCALL